jgi:hypothetical protein
MEVITNVWPGLTRLKNISIYITLQHTKKRLNMHPCTLKEMRTIGTYGGREELRHTIRIPSKMIFLKDSWESPKMNFSQNSLCYNKRAT